MDDSPGKRLASFRKSEDLSQRAFASALGVSPGRIGMLETDSAPLSRNFLEKISDVYGVSADWLLHGHGDMLRPPGQGFAGRQLRIEPPDSSRPGHGELRVQGKDYSFVRRMGLSLSAGNALEPLSAEDEDGLMFPQSWLVRRGLNPDSCVIVGVRGDSMAPAIPDGALVLLDCRVRRFDGAGIYAFTWEGQAYIKRAIPTGKRKDGRPAAIVLLSDNPAYSPITLSEHQMDEPRVAGKVRATIALMDD